ncbi:hypothetical protein C2I17_14055 [Niallia circulans]|nr:hypothetical protein C2I17_14055 [Niallia circulans]
MKTTDISPKITDVKPYISNFLFAKYNSFQLFHIRLSHLIQKKTSKYRKKQINLVPIHIFLHKVLPKLIKCYKPYKAEVWSEGSFEDSGYVVEDMFNPYNNRKVLTFCRMKKSIMQERKRAG